MCFTEGRSSIWTLASYSLNTKMRHGSRDLKNNCYARNALSVLIVSTFIFRALSRLKIYSKFPSRTEIIKKSFHFRSGFEKQLLCTKRPVSFNCLYIYFQGTIALENLLKIPISDRDNKKIVSF